MVQPSSRHRQDGGLDRLGQPLLKESKMSWLKKIVSSIGARGVKQVAEQVMEAMPTATCLTAEPDAAAAVSDSAQEDESPIKQRRYFVKKGLYVDNEEERAAAKA